jgi:hypothetical protein
MRLGLHKELIFSMAQHNHSKASLSSSQPCQAQMKCTSDMVAWKVRLLQSLCINIAGRKQGVLHAEISGESPKQKSYT